MMCGKGGSSRLCPVSFGLAVGITFGLGVFIWTLWVLFHGASPMMMEYKIPVPSLKDGTIHALWALLKGFVLGFFIALFYDLIVCCCKVKWCCGKSEEKSDEVKK